MLTREHLVIDRPALTATVLDRDVCQAQGIPPDLSPRDLFMLLLTADRTHAVPSFTYGDFRRLCGPLKLPRRRGDPGLPRKAMQFLKVTSGPTVVHSVFEARLSRCRHGCPHLKTVAGRFYCGACGCDKWRLAELRTKLWWARVECPAGRFPAIDERRRRECLQGRWRTLIGQVWRRVKVAGRRSRARRRNRVTPNLGRRQGVADEQDIKERRSSGTGGR